MSKIIDVATILLCVVQVFKDRLAPLDTVGAGNHYQGPIGEEGMQLV